MRWTYKGARNEELRAFLLPVYRVRDELLDVDARIAECDVQLAAIAAKTPHSSVGWYGRQRRGLAALREDLERRVDALEVLMTDAGLDAEMQRLIMRYWCDGVGWAKIAEALYVSTATANRMHVRALAAMGAELERRAAMVATISNAK